MNLQASAHFFNFFLSFCVKLQFVALHPWQSIAYTGLNVGLSRSEIARWCTVRDFCVISVLVIVTAVTCYDIRQEHQRQGLLVWTSNHQPQQTASYHLGMIQTKTAVLPWFQNCSQVVLIGWHGQGCQKRHSDPTVQVLTQVSDQTL